MTANHSIAPAAAKTVYEEIRTTSKAMWQALVAGRDAELERLLARRQRLLAQADAHLPAGPSAGAVEILALAQRTTELNETTELQPFGTGHSFYYSDLVAGAAYARRWTDKLYSLQLTADIAPFTAGQFTRLALDIDGERVARPYSFVNAPDNPDWNSHSLSSRTAR